MLLFLKKDASDIFFEAVSSRKKLLSPIMQTLRISTLNRKKLVSPIQQTSRTRTSNRKKLVATAQRPERIYKRTDEQSDTFCSMRYCFRKYFTGIFAEVQQHYEYS